MGSAAARPCWSGAGAQIVTRSLTSPIVVATGSGAMA